MADFATVIWARDMVGVMEQLGQLSDEEMERVATLLREWVGLRRAGFALTPQQLEVLFQHIKKQDLVHLAGEREGVLADFKGNGYTSEQFLIKADGRMPAGRYRASKG